MRGGLFVLQLVVHTDAGPVAFLEPQRRPRDAAIDGEASHRRACRADGLFGDGQVILHHRAVDLGGLFAIVAGDSDRREKR